MTDTNEFLNADEVAAFLRLPRPTVYKLAQDKAIPGLKIGKHWHSERILFMNGSKNRKAKM